MPLTWNLCARYLMMLLSLALIMCKLTSKNSSEKTSQCLALVKLIDQHTCIIKWKVRRLTIDNTSYWRSAVFVTLLCDLIRSSTSWLWEKKKRQVRSSNTNIPTSHRTVSSLDKNPYDWKWWMLSRMRVTSRKDQTVDWLDCGSKWLKSD